MKSSKLLEWLQNTMLNTMLTKKSYLWNGKVLDGTKLI